MTVFSGRAADLPVGSVVATSEDALIKGSAAWTCTFDDLPYSDAGIDEVLTRGAAVLRVGDGR